MRAVYSPFHPTIVRISEKKIIAKATDVYQRSRRFLIATGGKGKIDGPKELLLYE